MTKRQLLYRSAGLLVLLINALHALWYLSFTSVLWFIVFKLLLTFFFVQELINEKAPVQLPLHAYRALLLLSFLILLAFPKMNVGIQPFSGSYEVIETCTLQDVPGTETWKEHRLERLEMNYGLYDTREKTEAVYHLFWMFDWRYTIDDFTVYAAQFPCCRDTRHSDM